MRSHSANELRDIVSFLAGDGVTVLAVNVRAGIEDLTGRRLEQAQLIASETSHMILLRAGDTSALNIRGYIKATDGTLYVVDYPVDPRIPRAGMWLEVFCHVERTNS